MFNNFECVWMYIEQVLFNPRLGEVMILIDALDECEYPKREVFIDNMKKLLSSQQTRNIKLLVLTRANLVDSMADGTGEDTKHIVLDTEKIKRDLAIFIEGEVAAVSRKRKCTSSTRQKVTAELSDKNGGTFLWAALVLKNIAQSGLTEYRVIDVLRQFPTELNGVYMRILEDIDRAVPEYGRDVLRYILATDGRLTITQLAVAVHFRGGAQTDSKPLPTPDEIELLKTAIEACQVLLRKKDEGPYAVYVLLHQSVKDFLQSVELSHKLSEYRMGKIEASAGLSDALTGYLSAKEFRTMANSL